MDIAHVWNADPEALYGDWLIDPPDLESDADLRTAVIISLFSDRLAATDDELPSMSDPDRRGWWGDTGTDPPDNIGSKLWLYSRTVWTEPVRLGIEEAARNALQWMLDDGAADEVLVSAVRSEMGRIDLYVVIQRDGQRVFAGTYGWAWAQEFGRL
jgi:phage gp46-like protein